MNTARHPRWRFIDSGPLPGPENMAIDEALLDCFAERPSLPALRLYGWEPPAFSCGRFQEPAELLDLERCRGDGIAVVRRITGGGLLLHGNELTYALVCPVDFLPTDVGVKAAFFRLTTFLLDFYRHLGLAAVHAVDHYGSSRRLGQRTPLCGAGIESCDILLAGRKIGGNAQRRLKNAIFQHGSIPLGRAPVAEERYLRTPATQEDCDTTVLAEHGITADRTTLATLLATTFRETFGVELLPTALSPEEQKYKEAYMQKIA